MLAVSLNHYLRRGQSLRGANGGLARGAAPKRNLIFLMARFVRAKLSYEDVSDIDIKYIDRDEALEQNSVVESDIMMISHFILG